MEKSIVLLLDVDGVVNACPWDKQFPATHPEDSWHLVTVPCDGALWPIRYSTVVINRLNEISEKVEIRWLTTWHDQAQVLAECVGLNHFEVQKQQISEVYYPWWKMSRAAAALQENKAFIWVDDDLAFEWRNCATKLATAPTCLVQTHTSCGLTNEDLDYIEQFIEENENYGSQTAYNDLQPSVG